MRLRIPHSQRHPGERSGGDWLEVRQWLSKLTTADWQRRIDSLFQRDLLWSVVFVLFFSLLLFRQSASLDLSGLRPGAPAPVDIRAPYDLEIPDERATGARRQEERDKVLPVYDYNSSYLPDLVRRFHEGFGRARASLAGALRKASEGGAGAGARRARLLQSPPEALQERLRQDLGVPIDTDALRVLIRGQIKPELENSLIDILSRSLRGQVGGDREVMARDGRARVRDVAGEQEWREDNLALLPRPDGRQTAPG